MNKNNWRSPILSQSNTRYRRPVILLKFETQNMNSQEFSLLYAPKKLDLFSKF